MTAAAQTSTSENEGSVKHATKMVLPLQISVERFWKESGMAIPPLSPTDIASQPTEAVEHIFDGDIVVLGEADEPDPVVLARKDFVPFAEPLDATLPGQPPIEDSLIQTASAIAYPVASTLYEEKSDSCIINAGLCAKTTSMIYSLPVCQQGENSGTVFDLNTFELGQQPRRRSHTFPAKANPRQRLPRVASTGDLESLGRDASS